MRAHDSPTGKPVVAAVSARARWIEKTWRGPAIINAGPLITLCSDGRYWKTAPFKAAPNTNGVSVNSVGIECCDESESGTYELDRDPSGAITAVRFAPAANRDGKTAPYVSPITAGDHLEGFRADTSSTSCKAR